jgi:hypothetical protein
VPHRRFLPRGDTSSLKANRFSTLEFFKGGRRGLSLLFIAHNVAVLNLFQHPYHHFTYGSLKQVQGKL